jgi:DNA-binding XRE family transcriptional regulator
MATDSLHPAKSLRDFFSRDGNPTQADLARKLRVSRATICKLVSRQRTPSLRLAVKISEITGVPVDRLIGRAA